MSDTTTMADPAKIAHQWVVAMAGLGPDARKAVVAELLYGQPFGFTREELTELYNADEEMPEFWEILGRIADKIRALFPPE